MEAELKSQEVNDQQVQKKDEKKKNYVNPFIAWGSIAAELIIIFVFFMCALFLWS